MSELTRLQGLVSQLNAAELEVAEATIRLAAANEKYRTLAEVTLPEFMDEVGLEGGLKVEGGTLEVGEILTVNTSADRRPGICAWLKEIGQASAVKSTVTVTFGKDMEQAAEALRQRLEKEALLATAQQEVNTSTLKAIVKRRLEAGENVPMDLVGAIRIRKAFVKRPKSSKQFDGE